MKYKFKLQGLTTPAGTISIRALKDLVDTVIESSERGLRLAVQGESVKRGPIPAWLARSLDFTVTGLEKGSTTLVFEAPLLGETAPDQIKQQDLWYSKPKPEDTAISLLSRSVKEAVSENLESNAYDKGVLDGLLSFESFFKTFGTLIVPRIKRVIDGADSSGMTEDLGWSGGGGFRYYHLAPSLLEKDKWGNWVINKQYNAEMLAEALCKLEGFTYAPSDSIYWQHGHSTERDFVYVTTAHLTHDQLQQLSDEVGQERTLLVLCTAFRARADQFSNLTVKKIPKAVLSRCEYGHDDYSLQVENLPQAPPERGQQGLFEEEGEP